MLVEILTAVIAALPPTIVALLAWRVALRGNAAIQEVHLSLNSRLDALLEAEKKVSKQEGRQEEREER